MRWLLGVVWVAACRCGAVGPCAFTVRVAATTSRRVGLELRVAREPGGAWEGFRGPLSLEVWHVAADGSEAAPAYRATEDAGDVVSVWVDGLEALRGELRATVTARDGACGAAPLVADVAAALTGAFDDDADAASPFDGRAAAVVVGARSSARGVVVEAGPATPVRLALPAPELGCHRDARWPNRVPWYDALLLLCTTRLARL